MKSGGLKREDCPIMTGSPLWTGKNNKGSQFHWSRVLNLLGPEKWQVAPGVTEGDEH